MKGTHVLQGKRSSKNWCPNLPNQMQFRAKSVHLRDRSSCMGTDKFEFHRAAFPAWRLSCRNAWPALYWEHQGFWHSPTPGALACIGMSNPGRSGRSGSGQGSLGHWMSLGNLWFWLTNSRTLKIWACRTQKWNERTCQNQASCLCDDCPNHQTE